MRRHYFVFGCPNGGRVRFEMLSSAAALAPALESHRSTCKCGLLSYRYALILHPMIEKIHDYFLKNEKTFAFAESCTGGLLSAKFTERPGISKVFLGSVVSYHRSLKNQILGVPNSLIDVMGEVSLPVAIAMARGVKKLTKADWGLSITGIAGPGGGSPDKPVGFVCFGLVGPGFEETRFTQFAAAERRKIQLDSVEYAISFLWDSIHKETI